MKSFNLKESIEKRRIIPFANGPKLIKKELRAAQDDLGEAKRSLALKSYKWATIQAYYSIFHSARALLYAKKYREKSHVHLGSAIKALYVDAGKLSSSYYYDFVSASTLRELADYKGRFSEGGAKQILKSAEDSLAHTKKLLINR